VEWHNVGITVGIRGPIIMNSVEKLAIAAKGMWGKNTPWCHYLGAVHAVAANECEPSPERDALVMHIEKMRQQVREMCGSYDKLRSMVGALEAASGVEPIFYVDDNAGCTDKDFCPVKMPGLLT